MAFIPEDFVDSESLSVECPHGSCDEGFSTNLDHKTHIYYGETIAVPALSVAEEGIFVRPIPKDKQDTYDIPDMKKRSETPRVPIGEAFFKPKAFAQAWETPSKPEQVPQAENSKGEIGVAEKVAPPYADKDKVRRGSSITEDSEMEPAKKPANCGPGQKIQRGYKRKHRAYKDSSDRGKFYSKVLLGIMVTAHFVSVCDASAGNCFICSDKERCPNLQKIWHNDNLLYERKLGSDFPSCDKTRLPSKHCIVCISQTTTMIHCSESIEHFEAEDNTTAPLENFPKSDCQKMFHLRNRATRGTIPSWILLVLLLISTLFLQQV
ncbi:uncharacterized protein ACNS7B_018374 isoform 2-T2 [Menidia menidia]